MEEPSRASTLFLLVSILLIFLVGLDKQIVFRKVYGMEHMLRMKKFSTSDIHFKMSIFIPVTVVALGISLWKTIYTQAREDKDSVNVLFANIYSLYMILGSSYISSGHAVYLGDICPLLGVVESGADAKLCIKAVEKILVAR